MHFWEQINRFSKNLVSRKISENSGNKYGEMCLKPRVKALEKKGVRDFFDS